MDVEEQVSKPIDLSSVSSSELAREMVKRARMSHAARRVLSPCRFCTLEFGVREMRYHLHQCTMNPRRRQKGITADGE